MTNSKSLRSLGLALACAAVTFSLAVCAQAQTFSEQRPSSLRQLAALTASDSGGLGDGFGVPIAMSGDTIVVGAPYAHGTGAAYVFVKPASGWANMTETAELTASDGYPFLEFGLSVGISGNTIVVGSFGHNAAYVFTQPQGGWKNMTETAVLSNNNGVATLFGEYVAIDGTTIAVSEPKTFSYRGRVQVFTEPAGGWVSGTPTGSIIGSDTTAGSYFGFGLSVSGSTIVVGAYGNNNGTGAAYVFVQPASGWGGSHDQRAELTASDGKAQNVFGAAVAINGNTIVVGAPLKNNITGGAYVFVEPASGWKNMTETGKLSASGLVMGSYFGPAVAVAPTKIAVGSASTLTTGAVYTYVEPSGGWKNMLANSEVTVAGAEYSSAVAISNTILAAGASSDSVVYVFGP
jgi:uncharacterized protein (DUF2345 family)